MPRFVRFSAFFLALFIVGGLAKASDDGELSFEYTFWFPPGPNDGAPGPIERGPVSDVEIPWDRLGHNEPAWLVPGRAMLPVFMSETEDYGGAPWYVRIVRLEVGKKLVVSADAETEAALASLPDDAIVYFAYYVDR